MHFQSNQRILSRKGAIDRARIHFDKLSASTVSTFCCVSVTLVSYHIHELIGQQKKKHKEVIQMNCI